jgi:hypothetical protein
VRPVGENENGNPVVISFDSIDDSVVTVNGRSFTVDKAFQMNSTQIEV